MLDLVDTLFARYGLQTLRYDGSMNREAREAVLSRFRKPGGPKVILIRYVHRRTVLVFAQVVMIFISTKCGGVGLNLTSANRIIKYVHVRTSRIIFSISSTVWICHGTTHRNRKRMTVYIDLGKRRKSSSSDWL